MWDTGHPVWSIYYSNRALAVRYFTHRGGFSLSLMVWSYYNPQVSFKTDPSMGQSLLEVHRTAFSDRGKSPITFPILDWLWLHLLRLGLLDLSESPRRISSGWLTPLVGPTDFSPTNCCLRSTTQSQIGDRIDLVEASKPDRDAAYWSAERRTTDFIPEPSHCHFGLGLPFLIDPTVGLWSRSDF